MSIKNRLKSIFQLRRICLIIVDALALLTGVTINFFFTQFFAEKIMLSAELLPICMTLFVAFGILGMLISVPIAATAYRLLRNELEGKGLSSVGKSITKEVFEPQKTE